MPPDKPSVAAAAAVPAPKAKVIRLDIRRSPPDKAAADFNTSPTTPTTPLPDSEPNALWDNCRTCPRCKYTFCLVCRGVWHGVHTPCQFNDVAAVVREYMDGDEGVKRAMEARLGIKGTEALHALIREHEREVAFRAWVSDNAALCPGCQASIQKR